MPKMAKVRRPKQKTTLEKQLYHVKSIEKSRVPYLTFFENGSDSETSECANLSPTEKHKYIRLMS